MGIKLKDGKTFSDRYHAEPYSTQNGYIDNCNANKKTRVCTFVLEIYSVATTLEQRQAGALPVVQVPVTVTGEDFDTNFGINALDTSNQYANAYDYLLTTLRHPSTFDAENVETLGALVYGVDWVTNEE